jgi:hypothetical protein
MNPLQLDLELQSNWMYLLYKFTSFCETLNIEMCSGQSNTVLIKSVLVTDKRLINYCRSY